VLKTLARSVPEGSELLAELIRDSALGPVVLLAERDDLRPESTSRAPDVVHTGVDDLGVRSAGVRA
jgi:hypothetical protein